MARDASLGRGSTQRRMTGKAVAGQLGVCRHQRAGADHELRIDKGESDDAHKVRRYHDQDPAGASLPSPEQEHADDVGGGQYGKCERDREVNAPPLLDDVERQAVPVHALIDFVRREPLAAHVPARLLQASSGSLQQKLAGQAAADIDQHGPYCQPPENGIEVDAGMHQHQQ